MIRAIQFSDLPRCLIMGLGETQNRVYSRADPGRSTPEWIALPIDAMRGMSGSAGSIVTVWIDGARILCMAVTSRMAGPQSWELSRLQVGAGAEDCVAGVLTAAFATAQKRSATHMSARVLAGDPVGSELSRAGLLPAHTETLYRGRGSGARIDPPQGIRPREGEDEHGIFRLYSACTPAEVRALEGMTLEQWSASRWDGPGRADEYVLESGDRITGWLRVLALSTATDLSIMVHPESPDQDAASLTDLGLALAPSGSPVVTLIPGYQPAAGRAADRAGLQAEAEFEVHARSVRATEKIFQEVGAYEVVSS